MSNASIHSASTITRTLTINRAISVGWDCGLVAVGLPLHSHRGPQRDRNTIPHTVVDLEAAQHYHLRQCTSRFASLLVTTKEEVRPWALARARDLAEILPSNLAV